MSSIIRPDHHLAKGGFRNPPGSPRRTSSKWEALRFFASFPFSDRMPEVPAGHVLSKKEVKDIVAYLRVLANQNDEESLLRIMNFPQRGIGNTSISKITHLGV